MFESSTWNLRNRRSFAVLERLGETAGTGHVMLSNFDSPPPQGLTEKQRAMALAEAGEHGLMLVIETAGRGTRRRGKGRKVWRAMRPESGARSSILLAHGLAEMTGQLASAPGHHLSVKRQREARDLLRAAFPWSDEEEAFVVEEARSINPVTAEGHEHAFISLALHAVAGIVGHDTAASLPAFQQVADGDDLDFLLGGLTWQACMNQVSTAYLCVSDPSGLGTRGPRSA